MTMSGLRKILMCSIISSMSLSTAHTYAGDAGIRTINDMEVVSLVVIYQYNPDGVPLIGFINSLSSVSYNDKVQKTLSPDDKVEFTVCNTGKEIKVPYRELKPVNQTCPLAGKGRPYPDSVVAEWKIDSGNLVAKKLVKSNIDDQKFRNIPISALPQSLQAALTAEKQGNTVAVTLSYENRNPILGVLKPFAAGGM
jgi:hypothetical protein